MSTRAPNIYPFPKARRAPGARPVAKLQALERVRGLIGDGELNHTDMTVATYIAEVTDRSTGAACVELEMIAVRIGRHRSTVVRSIQRLIKAGVVERISRRDRKRCFASRYQLVVPASEKGVNDKPGRCTDAPTPVHRCTISHAFTENLLPNGPIPYRGDDAQNARYDRRFWVDEAEWLAREGKYARWGPEPGEAFRLARDDLDRWRQRCGDSVVVAALRKARRSNDGTGWFGDYLIERLDMMLSNG